MRKSIAFKTSIEAFQMLAKSVSKHNVQGFEIDSMKNNYKAEEEKEQVIQQNEFMMNQLAPISKS